MNRQNRANAGSVPHARGAVRPGGIVAAVLAAALAVALIVVIKRSLSSPAPTQAAAPGAAGGMPAVSAESREAAADALAQREYPKAAALYQRMLENPDAAEDVDLRLSLVEALLGQHDYPGAYEQYEKIVAIQGKNVSAATHFQAGTVASKAGRLDRAEEHYSMAQSADASRYEYPLFLGMVQLRQGDGGKTEAGLASLLRAIKLNPECAEAYGTLAEVYLRDNKLEIAAPNVARARELQPEVARWRVVEARILKRQGKPADALTLLTAMDPADQATSDAVTLMAECYGMLQRPADAADLFAKAAKRDPANAENHYQAAMWYQRAGDAEKARAFAKTAAMMGHEGAKELQNSLG